MRRANVLKGVTVAVAAFELAAGCGDDTGAAAPSTTVNRVTAQYDLAEQAVWAALCDGDLASADQLIVEVVDQTPRALAELAIDATRARLAVSRELHDDEHEQADAILGRIQDATIAQQATDAINLDRQADDIWNQTPRDNAGWLPAHEASVEAWNDLHVQAMESWYDIYQQADATHNGC